MLKTQNLPFNCAITHPDSIMSIVGFKNGGQHIAKKSSNQKKNAGNLNLANEIEVYIIGVGRLICLSQENEMRGVFHVIQTDEHRRQMASSS